MRNRTVVVGFLALAVGLGCGGSDTGKTGGKGLSEQLKEKAGEAAKATEGLGQKVEDAAKKAGQAASDVGKKAAEKFEEFSDKVRDDYLFEARKKLGGLDKDLDGLKERISQAGADAKPKLQAQYDKLAEQRKALGPKVEALQKASAGTWQELKKGFGSAWDELNKGLQEAGSAK